MKSTAAVTNTQKFYNVQCKFLTGPGGVSTRASSSNITISQRTQGTSTDNTKSRKMSKTTNIKKSNTGNIRYGLGVRVSYGK